MAAYTTVSTITSKHIIKIDNGRLTIAGDAETLELDEIMQLLEVLVIWQYGLEATPTEPEK